MNAWHKREFLVFDTETTGTDVNADRIVTATIAQIFPGAPVSARSWLINPGVLIPKAASDVHGVSNERAQADGQHPGEAIIEIAKTLKAATLAGVPVVAFNASFDFTVLDRECRRQNAEYPIPFVVDPFVIDKELDKWRKGLRTLTATCEHYNVRLDGAHDATEDALAAGRVAWSMAEQWPAELQIPLAELHAKQAEWRHAWAEEFQHYLRTRKGEPDAVVNGEWPIQALPAEWDATAHPVEKAA
jgi:DNA polymerase-3 subunit epsilon